MSVTLSVHGDVLIENSELSAVLEALLAEQEKESRRLTELISYSLGTLAFVRK